MTNAETLKRLIDDHRCSQADVSRATGISEATISRILSGRRRISLRHIPALAKAFKVRPATFLDDLDAPADE